ncbi:MAG TPA: hypothetical protein VK907_01175, partial [Phnomibacter sp.]|nr:hypothetical protein [Phnomibacter sp.]
TNTTANLTSSLGQFAFAARVSPLASKKVSPFFELQAGYFNMSSRIYIEDPTDPLGCRALEERNIVNSGTSFWSPGAGVQIFLGKGKNNEMHSLEVAARNIRGGKLEYANMNRLYHDHGQTGEPEPDLTKGEFPYMVTFVNVTTNEQHQHSVAELYKHPLRVLQFNVTYSYRFGKKH